MRNSKAMATGWRHSVAAAVLVVPGLLAAPALAGDEARTPGAVTGIAVDRAATAAAARQILRGEPIVVDWANEPPPRTGAPQRQYRAATPAPPPALVERSAPSPLPTVEQRRLDQQQRLVEGRLATVARQLDSLPRRSAADRALNPDRDGRERARAAGLEQQRRALAFEARMLAIDRTGSAPAPGSPAALNGRR